MARVPKMAQRVLSVGMWLPFPQVFVTRKEEGLGQSCSLPPLHPSDSFSHPLPLCSVVQWEHTASKVGDSDDRAGGELRAQATPLPISILTEAILHFTSTQQPNRSASSFPYVW